MACQVALFIAFGICSLGILEKCFRLNSISDSNEHKFEENLLRVWSLCPTFSVVQLSFKEFFTFIRIQKQVLIIGFNVGSNFHVHSVLKNEKVYRNWEQYEHKLSLCYFPIIIGYQNFFKVEILSILQSISVIIRGLPTRRSRSLPFLGGYFFQN